MGARDKPPGNRPLTRRISTRPMAAGRHFRGAAVLSVKYLVNGEFMSKPKVIFASTLLVFLVGCASAPKVDISGLELKASSGDPQTQNDLGSHYQFGDGVDKNFAKALMWYEKSAAQGLPLAKANLGYMYDLGLGTNEDDSKAVELYESAAEAGSARGMINLGSMYVAGTGVEKDYIKAYKWFDIARFLTQKSSDMDVKWSSRGALDELSKFMTKEQIAEGKELSKEWLSENQ